MRWIAFAIAGIAVTVWVAAWVGQPRPVAVRTSQSGGESRQDLDFKRLAGDLQRLSEPASRMTGTQGAGRAAGYIQAELQAMGALAVATQQFEVPAPVAGDTSLTADTAQGRVSIPLHPLWPNLACTGQTPPEGLSGLLVNVGAGTDAQLAGKPLAGSLVVMDWATNLEWLSVPEFGGKAVIFRANDQATGYTARNKFMSVAANIPRYYADEKDLPALDRMLSGEGPVTATISCAMSWQRVTAVNILAQIAKGEQAPGAKGSAETAPVLFHAYYDSISVVPDLAPGAEQACGAAALLELGRFFARYPPRRPVYLLFTSGHGQALLGMTQFVGLLRQVRDRAALTHGPPPRRPDPFVSLLTRMGTPGLLTGLDFSSGSDQFGVFAVGKFRSRYEHIVRPAYSVLGEELDRYAKSFGKVEDGAATSASFVDCINLTRGRGWWTYFPYQSPFESELPVVGGFAAVTLATINDDRRRVDTPGDRFENLRLDVLERQLATIPGRRAGLAAIARALADWCGPFVSRNLPDVWATLEGRVVWLDQEKDYTPNEPLAGALVFLKTQRGDKHLMGTRGIPALLTDDKGRFRFDGLIQTTDNAEFNECLLEAYGVAAEPFCTANPAAVAQYQKAILRGRVGQAVSLPAPSQAGQPAPQTIVLDGAIFYAVDMARQKDYPWSIEIKQATQHLNIVCFPCRSVTLTGLTDPRGYIPLKDVAILEASTLAAPFQFGKSVVDGRLQDPAETMVTLWADPTLRVMLTIGLGFQEKRLVLNNNSLEAPEGKGFVLEELRTMPSMVLQGAGDMWRLDEVRAAKLERNGVHNPRISAFHGQARQDLEKAREALTRYDYQGYRIAAEKGWALEGRAYGEVLSTVNNMVRGVLFYLALLLPFSYCLERLLIAAGTIKKRIIWMSVIFSVCFLLLAVVHPAFRFTLTPLLVLLAFIIIALVATVSTLLVGRMDTVLQERKQAASGRHEEQQNLGGIALRAVDLGVSNIRRRPQRAFLTGLTVTTVTFILLSFVSLTPEVSISRLKHPDGVAAYRGLLTRNKTWLPLPAPLYLSVSRNFGENVTGDAVGRVGNSTHVPKGVVAARAWFFSDREGKLSQIDVTPAGLENPTRFTAVSLLCLSRTEPQVTGVDKALFAGRWFNDDNERAVILPLHMATQLGLATPHPSLSPGGRGWGEGAVGKLVRVFGQDLPVVGIVDEKQFDAIRDLDGEPLTPVNFVLQQQMKAQDSRPREEPDTLEKYVHYSSDQVLILPLESGVRLGAMVRSVAVRAREGLDIALEAEGYAKRSNLTILASDGGNVMLYAARDTNQVSAAWQIVVPLFLGFIMVLGTMMGSVYERVREIFVYNSVGLSPGNVASLFLTESAVYALVGAALGYLLGQGVARGFQATGLLPGLSLNYTAGSTVFVTILTMAIVLLSAIYPALQAFHAATPDAVKEAAAVGTQTAAADTLGLFLPFTATQADVFAMQAYMAEFLASLEGVTIGELAVDNLQARLDCRDGPLADARSAPLTLPSPQGGEGGVRGAAPALYFRAWLAPFDLGVSHDAALRIVYREERGVHQYHLTATRFSGDQQNWRRLVPRFIRAIRKQLLMWRVLSPQEIGEYREQGRRMFGVKTEAGSGP